jgi:pilus assembly protein CpaB
MSRSTVKVGAARFGALGFLAVALGCAALAAFALGNTMRSSYSGSRVEPVVVAKTELRAGQALTADLFEVREWPSDAVPAGSFPSIDLLLASAAGATPTVGLLAGEPLTSGRLSSGKDGTGIGALVHPSMRAIAIEVDHASGYTGLLYPGAMVDVVATVRDPMGRGPSSRIAVQNARVLSVGLDTDVATRKVQRTDGGLDQSADRGTYVTLEVAPSEVEVLAVARTEGRIDLVLRNAGDDQLVDTTGATPDKFSAFATPEVAIADAEPEIAPEPEARKPTVKRRDRHIQIVASDKPDVPAARGGHAIEVQYAK